LCSEEWGVKGVPQAEWPDWLKYLAREDDKARKRIIRNKDLNEVPHDPSILARIIDENAEILQ
jgi:hypothetical protein